jgi:hypothetical protein
MFTSRAASTRGRAWIGFHRHGNRHQRCEEVRIAPCLINQPMASFLILLVVVDDFYNHREFTNCLDSCYFYIICRKGGADADRRVQVSGF